MHGAAGRLEKHARPCFGCLAAGGKFGFAFEYEERGIQRYRVGFKHGARLEAYVDQVCDRSFRQLTAFDSCDFVHHRCVFNSGEFHGLNILDSPPQGL